MKRLFFTLVIIVFAIFGFGCGKQQDNMLYSSEKYMSTDLSDGHYLLDENEKIIYPYNNKIYAVGDKFGYYDAGENMRYTKLADQSADAIFVDEYGIYLLCEQKIMIYDHDGTEIGSYEVRYREREDLQYFSPCIIADEKNIYYSFCMIGEIYGESSGEFQMFILEKETGVSRLANLACDKSMIYAYGLHLLSDGVLLIGPYEDPVVLTGRNGIYHYSVKNDELALTWSSEYSMNLTDVNPENSVIYLCSENINTASFTLGALSSESDSLAGDCIIGMEQHCEAVGNIIGYNAEDGSNPACSTDKMFFTGYDYLLWDRENHVLSVYGVPSNDEGSTLTVLRPDVTKNENGETVNSFFCTYSEEDIAAFSAESGYQVKSIAYAADTYGDRLRMRLLAGEDDFDIVYFDDLCASMLPAILNYSLYMPLEGFDSITKGFEQYMDGVQDVMTHDGHIIGIPFTMTEYCVYVSENYSALGFPEISNSWTQDDFWAVCEAAVGKLDGKTPIFNVVEERILLYPIIQYGAITSNISYDDILAFTQNLKKYTEAGVLGSGGISAEVSNAIVPAQSSGWMWQTGEDGMLVSAPLYKGKKYAVVTDFIFANAKTKNPQLAAEYLTYMLDKSGELRSGLSYLLEDTNAYYERIWTDEVMKKFDNSPYPLNTWTRVPCEINTTAAWITGSGSAAIAGSELAPYDADGTFMTLMQQLLNSMLADEISPEEAAKQIYDEACYRYME